MKGLLGILLIVVLVLPVLGAGCDPEPAAGENGGGIEVQLPTPSPEDSPVGGEEGSVQLQPGSTITFRLATPTPTPGEGLILTVPPGLGEEWVIGPIELPEPGDTVVITLNCEARAEELIILGQYLELRGYIRDLNAETEGIFQGWLSLFSLLVISLPPFDLYPNLGTVTGILQVEADTVLSLPFVTNIRVMQGVDPDLLEILLGRLLDALLTRDVDALTQLHIELGE